MTEPNLQQVQPPSKKSVAMATLAALVVAGIVLVVAVLPAEYGTDPLGAGRLLGLIQLNEAEGAAAPVVDAAQAARPAPGMKKGEIRTPPALTRWNTDQGGGLYKVDSKEFEIGPRQGMEFKYRMEKGAGLVYVWDSPVKVRFEFHGEPDGKAKGTSESYAIDEAEGVDRGSGNFVAPFTGIHGWYWENPTDQTITVRLTSAGFYSAGKEFRKGQESNHELQDVKVANRKAAN
jgi:hypothetical protein